MLRLTIQVEKQESGLWWSDPATAALEHRSLPEGVAFEEYHRPHGVMR